MIPKEGDRVRLSDNFLRCCPGYLMKRGTVIRVYASGEGKALVEVDGGNNDTWKALNTNLEIIR